ncbi:MAG: calcium-translocating P-type ATPase, SERCA-type [Candidatus Aenigmatarchaeota archaeon]
MEAQEKNWHTMAASDVMEKLETAEKGLSQRDAEKRMEKYGLNEFVQKKKISKLEIFISQFKNTLVAILIIAALFSFFIDFYYHAEISLDGIVILLIVIINAIIGFREEYNAEKALEALKRLAAQKTIVIRDGKKQEIETKFLVPGDVVVLEEGSKIPADIRLFQVSNMKIDEASLTGESSPVTKKSEEIKNAPLAERENMCYMGTILTYGRGEGVVVSTGMSTEMGKIAGMIQEAEEEPTPLQKSLKRFGKNLTVMILAVCVLVVIFGVLRGGELIDMLLTGIALAVAAIPEGLPAVVTITLTFGVKKMAKKNAIVRRLPSVESLGSVTVICSDKTGTLTRNEMAVRSIYYNKLIDVTGKGYEPVGEFLDSGKRVDPAKDKHLSLLLKTGLLCNNAELRKENSWVVVGDPTEGAVISAAGKSLDIDKTIKAHPRIYEIPFSSERKMMSVINNGEKTRMYSKGAPEIILNNCTKIYNDGKITNLTSKEKDEILSANHRLADKALRVLAFAYKDVSKKTDDEKNLVFLGLMGMIDPPRASVKDDIKICKKAGIMSVMITGDNRNTAVAIAKEIGILDNQEGRVLTGDEMEGISDKELFKIVKDVTVYARVNPVHKLKIVEALQKHGEVVAMTGDGVNDAPALKKADVGVSMGIKGTDVAKEASDMVLKDDNFTTIVTAIKEGRRIFDNTKKFIHYLLSCNMGEVLVVLGAVIIGFSDPVTGGFIIPVTAIQLLWINLVTDGVPATALGVDPPAKNIMSRPPRDPKERIMARGPVIDMIIVGIIIMIGTLFLFTIKLPLGIEKARTVAFTTLVMFQMFRVQSMHMGRDSVGFFSNRKLSLAIISSLILQLVVIYVPFLQVAFGTVVLGFMEWVEIILVSCSLIIVMGFKSKVLDMRVKPNFKP